MSGIAGIFRWQGPPVSASELLQLCRPSSFRARLGVNTVIGCGGKAGLAQLASHPALTRPAAQEELGLGQGALAVADCRLDNRLSLLADLRQAGFQAAPEFNDSQLILAAYLCWGEDCAGHLIGDYSFAVVDPRENQIFAARSLGGLRGFSYTRTAGCFRFGSDLRMLVQSDLEKRHLDGRGLGDYLISNSQDLERTLFSRVRHLAPAHCLTVKAEGIRRSRFWRPEKLSPLLYRNPEDYAEHFRSLLFDAVADRLDNGSPLAIPLSGGLDSSSVAVIAADISRQRGGVGRFYLPHFFSRLSPKVDERKYALSLQSQGLRIRPLCNDRNLRFRPGASELDSPLSIVNRSFETALAEATGAGCKVWLSGHGGDELFSDATYAYFDYMRSLQWWKVLPWVKSGMQSGYSLLSQLRSYFFAPLLPRFARRWIMQRRGSATHLVTPIWVVPAFASSSQMAARIERNWVPKVYPGFARNRQFRHLLAPPGTSQLLNFWDRLLVGEGIRPAAPFLDQRLAEFVLRVPLSVCAGTSGAETKRVLRMAMKGLLPEMVRTRVGKAGGSDEVGQLLRESSSLVEQILQGSRLVEAGILLEDTFRHSFRGWMEQRAGFWPNSFYAATSLELWFREQIPDAPIIDF